MNPIYGHGLNWRVSPDLWSAYCRDIAGKGPISRFSLRHDNSIRIYFNEIDVSVRNCWIQLRKVNIGKPCISNGVCMNCKYTKWHLYYWRALVNAVLNLRVP